MALPPLVRSALARYRERLEAAFPGRVRRVTLFGSVARGEATEDSDVDVLVVLDHLDAAARRTAIDEGGRTALETSLPIAPLVLGEDEWDLLVRRERLLPREIARDGIEA